ncbi:hypothetical protein R3P38DRAFT_3296609 [Favolaschia claudopus]|uniref:Uncharacterized protein n=1 Tax=Favolaschia claudopus TaxID=2862362 RepID=A0AAV9Z832_9AGAR
MLCWHDGRHSGRSGIHPAPSASRPGISDRTLLLQIMSDIASTRWFRFRCGDLKPRGFWMYADWICGLPCRFHPGFLPPLAGADIVVPTSTTDSRCVPTVSAPTMCRGGFLCPFRPCFQCGVASVAAPPKVHGPALAGGAHASAKGKTYDSVGGLVDTGDFCLGEGNFPRTSCFAWWSGPTGFNQRSCHTSGRPVPPIASVLCDQPPGMMLCSDNNL